ncbi:Gp49 family protein [Shinella zoogloeoides]|uniref:Gp49 family protein n=1 Tax=Shinella zoogloeoides TaxID=352475 RepID=UPI001F592448|nr:Gp49 family protein [Shinella zoogloeoides]
MSKDEAQIETEIQAKGLNAPRLTPELIDAAIVSEQYHVFPGTTLTVCALTLRNGYIVTGESAAASPSNFDEAIGRKISRDNARNKIWALEGYLLREFLHQTSPARISRLGQLLRDAEAINGGSMPHEAVAHTVLDDARRYPV